MQASFNTEVAEIPLEGIMVGNGATNWTYDVWPSFTATAAAMTTIPLDLWRDAEKYNCVAYFHGIRPATKSPECDAVAARLDTLTGKLNWYDLYRQNYDLSPLRGSDDRTGYTEVGGEPRTYKRGYTQREYTPFAEHIFNSEYSDVVLGDYVSYYMNQQSTRDAFNIPDSVQTYEQCSSTLQYHVQDEASYWIYPILRNKYKLMFYSGDTDGAVSTYGSKQWIKSLNWPIKESWRPWYTSGQVSGYVEVYDGLDFVTVKGVGHMAPQWARQAVTDMISAYVHDETF